MIYAVIGMLAPKELQTYMESDPTLVTIDQRWAEIVSKYSPFGLCTSRYAGFQCVDPQQRNLLLIDIAKKLLAQPDMENTCYEYSKGRVYFLRDLARWFYDEGMEEDRANLKEVVQAWGTQNPSAMSDIKRDLRYLYEEANPKSAQEPSK